MPKFRHMYDFAFSVVSEDPEGKDVTAAMLIAACRARLVVLGSNNQGAEMIEACGLCDTYEEDDHV